MILLRKIILCVVLTTCYIAGWAQAPVISAKNTTPCSGQNFFVNPVTGGGDVVPVGTTYSWPAPTASGVTGMASGTNASNFSGTLTLATTSTPQVIVNYTVTPSNGGIPGDPFTVTVTVNPYAKAADITVTPGAPNGIICGGLSTTLTAAITGGSNVDVSHSTFTWYSAANLVNSLATGPTFATATLSNNTTYYVSVSSSNACPNASGTGQAYTITVSGVAPDVVQPLSQTICASISSTSNIVFTSDHTVGAVFNWTATNAAAIGMASSGTGNIPSFTPINNANANITSVITVIPYTATNSCYGIPRTFSLQVGPIPSASTTSMAVCSGTPLSYSPPGVPSGTTYTWSAPTTPGITSSTLVQNSATASFNPTLFNSTNASIDIVFTLLPRTGTPAFCPGNTFSITVTVKPTPQLDASQSTTTCSGTAFVLSATGSIIPAGIYYTWGIPSLLNGSITGATSQLSQQSVISQTLVNNGSSNANIRYTITPGANGCVGQAFSGTITIYPKPVLTNNVTTTICNNIPFSYTPSSATAPITYAWTRAALNNISNPAVTNGTNSISETLVNTGTNNELVTYIYTLSANGCNNTQNVLVTVKPTLRLSTDLTKVTCSNAVFAYTASSSTLGTVLTWSRAAITGIANTAAGGGAAISETLINTSNVPIDVTYEYHNTSGGCSDISNLVVTVNPLPQVNTIPDQVICSGVSPVLPLTGSTVAATVYNWANTNANIGLTNSGAGDISFLAYDQTYVPISGLITVTPNANSCNGVPMIFRITVNPAPTLSSSLTIPEVCSGVATSYSPTGNVANTGFTWTRQTVIGIDNAAGSGSGRVSETLSNGSNVPLQVPYLFTLTANGCSTQQLVSVTVNPVPTMFNPGNQLACNNSTKVVNFSGSIVSGTAYFWTNDNPAIGIPSVGTGDIFFVANTTSPDSVYANIVARPQAYGCQGPSVSFRIVINPPLSLTSSLTPPAVCSNSLFGYTPSSTASNPIYIWSRAGINGISNAPASGSGTIQEILINTTSAPITVLYDFTLSSNGCVKSETVSVSVSPALVLDNQNLVNEVCSGTQFNFDPSGNIANVPYLWSRDVVTGISNTAGSGTGSIRETLVNTTTIPIEVAYRYTLGIGASCAADQVVKVTVKPIPQLTGSKSISACSNAPVAYTPIATIAGTNYNWSRAAVTGIANTPAVGLVGISESLINTTTNAVTATYLYSLTNYNGCSNTETLTVSVKPAPIAGVAADQSICADDITKVITFTSNLPNTTFNWTNTEPAIGLAASGTGATIPAFKSVNNSSGQLVAIVQVTPVSDGCSGQTVAVARITVNRAITSSFIETQPTVACEGQTVGPFVASVPLGGDGSTYVFQWQVSTDSVNFTNIPGATARNLVAPAVTKDSWYRMTTVSLGCSAVTPWNVRVPFKKAPVVTISNQDNFRISKGNSTQLVATVDTLTASLTTTYLWTPPLTVSDFRASAPIVTPLSTTTYLVAATSQLGCTGYLSATVEVYEGFQVFPNNILTPNGDGFNDKWVVKNIQYYPDNTVKVYNVNSILVWSAINYTGDWEGKDLTNTNKLPTGTYYYIITINPTGATPVTVKGFLTILN